MSPAPNIRVVLKEFSARRWSVVPHEYATFKPGDRVVALRHESGYSIFARDSDPKITYLIEISLFKQLTSSKLPE